VCALPALDIGGVNDNVWTHGQCNSRLKLTSELQNITAPQLVPNYTASDIGTCTWTALLDI